MLEQIADYTARLAQVVEVTAVGGPSHDGTIIWQSPVRLAAANSGPATPKCPCKLARYLDPDRDRALRSLAEANAALRARRDADRPHRSAISCRNTGPSLLDGPAPATASTATPKRTCWRCAPHSAASPTGSWSAAACAASRS